MKRRKFMNVTLMGAGASIIGSTAACDSKQNPQQSPLPVDQFSSRTADVQYITVDERKSRVAKAQELMNQIGMKAILLDAGTSLDYFTGIRWGGSERPMIAIIPANGEVSYVCPGFEEDRLNELIKIGDRVYPWQED